MPWTCNIAMMGLSLDGVFLLLFVLAFVFKLPTKRRKHQVIKIIYILCITSQILLLVDYIWGDSIRHIIDKDIVKSAEILFEIICRMISAWMMIKILSSYHRLKHTILPCIYIIIALFYILSVWIAIPAYLKFKDNLIFKYIHKYYLLVWITEQFVVVCFLCIFIWKMRAVMVQSYKYQSMFIIHKNTLGLQQKSIKKTLYQCICVCIGIALYNITTIIAYIFIYICGDTFRDSFMYLILMRIIGHTLLNWTVYYFIRVATIYDPLMKQSITQQTKHMYEDEDDLDDDTEELEFSVSNTTQTSINTSTRYNNAFTQIIYLQE
eukprot:67228_1